MKRIIFAALVSVCVCAAAWTEEPAAGGAVADNTIAAEAEETPAFHEWIAAVSALLGTSLEEAFSSFGVPQKVASARGEEAWQDDVVFEYPCGLSLFWYKDRVWQLRFGPGFHGRFRGAGMGSTSEEIIAVLGKPFHAAAGWILYHLAGNGYPLRVRLFFGEAGLEDIYIYRADF